MWTPGRFLNHPGFPAQSLDLSHRRMGSLMEKWPTLSSTMQTLAVPSLVHPGKPIDCTTAKGRHCLPKSLLSSINLLSLSPGGAAEAKDSSPGLGSRSRPSTLASLWYELNFCASQFPHLWNGDNEWFLPLKVIVKSKWNSADNILGTVFCT